MPTNANSSNRRHADGLFAGDVPDITVQRAAQGAAAHPHDGFPPTPRHLAHAVHGPEATPRREHGWLLRTPGPPLPAPEAFRAADRARSAAAATPELQRDIERHFARACAWWSFTPGPDDLARAIAATEAGPDDGIAEAWILEASPWLWIRAWTERVYGFEDLVRTAVRTRLDHRLFRHAIAPYGRTSTGKEQ